MWPPREPKPRSLFQDGTTQNIRSWNGGDMKSFQIVGPSWGGNWQERKKLEKLAVGARDEVAVEQI